jgi:hypothetical protein
LRIRHARHSYMSAINKRANIQEFPLRPLYATAIAVLPEGDLLVSGYEKEMYHTVMGFAPIDDKNIKSILDLLPGNSVRQDVDPVRKANNSSRSIPQPNSRHA